jgi:hypothetical protein
MKKKSRILIVCFLAFLSVQCNTEQKTTDGETAIIKLDFKAEKTNVHEIGLINNIKLLKLECDEVIGEIRKVVRHNDRLYLMDNQTSSVFIFDTTGVYISHIAKRGQGPEEYLQLKDIYVDPADATLNLVSRADRKILKYDSDGQHLLKVNRTPKSFSYISIINDGYLGYMDNDIEDPVKPYNIWSVSTDGKVKDHFIEIDKSWNSRSFSSINFLSKYKEFTYYIAPMDYHIYAFRNGELSVPYEFDLGDLAWPEDKKDSREYDRIKDSDYLQFQRLIRSFNDFQETNNHLITRFATEGQGLLGVYNKQSKKTCIAEKNSSYKEYPLPFGNIICFDEQAIYTYIDASSMRHYWIGENIKDRYPEQLKRLRQRFENIDEEDNPFLVIYSIN